MVQRYKRKFTVPGPKRDRHNSNSKFINKKAIKIFDETYDFVNNEDLLEANMEYLIEMMIGERKRR